MDRKKMRVLGCLASLFAVASCMETPPVFSRPPYTLFSKKMVVGTYVATFTKYTRDTMWIYPDGVYRHVIYDEEGKIIDMTSKYAPFENSIWEDPCAQFDDYVINGEMDTADSLKQRVTLAMSKWKTYDKARLDSLLYHEKWSLPVYFGRGYEGNPRNSLWIEPRFESPHYYYRKVSSALL